MKLLSLVLSLSALTCSAFSSVPIATSQGWDSESFLLMRPSVVKDKFVGIATCYNIQEDGGFKKRWEIVDKYSSEGRLFLGEHGNVLAKIVEVVHLKPDPEKVELVQQTTLEFYREGKIFKKMSVKDVVDPQKLVTSGVFSGALATHQILKFDEATAPKMGNLF